MFKRAIFLLLITTLSLPSFSMIKKVETFTADEQKTMSQVKIEAGGIIMMEQYLQQKNKGGAVKPFLANFVCLPNKLHKVECKLLSIK